MFYEEQFSFINDDISIMIDSLINNNMMRDHILFLGSVVGLWLAHWTPVEWSGEKLRVESIAGAPKHPLLETEPSPGRGHCFVFLGKTVLAFSQHLFPTRCTPHK